MLKNFRTYQIAVQFYRAAQTIEVPTILKDQLQRASMSIALNLAEGSGKRTKKDQLRFYTMALGSVRECEAIFELAFKTGVKEAQLLELLARHVVALCKALRTPP